MTYTKYIREGVRLIHKNWKLIVVQFMMSVVNCIGFFVIVGIPIFVAISALSLDITDLTKLREFLRTIDDPVELIRRYLGIGLAILTAIFIYMLFVFSVWIYVFGGSAGIIGRSLKAPLSEFKLSEFMKEGRRLFFPLLGYTAIVGALFIVGLFTLGIIAGSITAILTFFKFYGSEVGYFLRVFFAVLTIVLGLILTFGALTITLQGSVLIVLNSLMPMQSLKASYRYFKEQPASLGFYAILLLGFILINLLFFLLGLSFKFIPHIGIVIAVPYQIFLSVLQGYLNLVVLSAVFVSYFSTSLNEPSARSSIQAKDTSLQEALEQVPPLSGSDKTV